MIDIHSHILAGLDDGAKTPEESLAMVRMAAETGTTDIVATPHSNLEFSFDPDLVDRKIAELQEAAGDIIRIHRGCDFHLHYDNIQDALADPSKYAINRKCYVLVEFSQLLVSRATENILHRIREAGMMPVITHPERHALLQQRIEQLATWVENGWYLQVTAQSFLGRFGKAARNFSEKLLSRGLVHFVASDAHDTAYRPPRLDQAYAHIADKYGAELAELLCAVNPKAALEGTPIETGAVPPPPLPRKWFQFWS